MARFQTRLAELLEQQTPEYARPRWVDLAALTGVSDVTLMAWYHARVGSDTYLSGFSGAVAAKLMRYFGLDRLDQLIEVVLDEGDDSPSQFA